MGIAQPPPPVDPMRPGDIIRIRRMGSDDGWCAGIVEKASLNGESVLMRVSDGVLRPAAGGLITGVIAFTCDFEEGTAKELLTETELEVERRSPRPNYAIVMLKTNKGGTIQ